MDREIELHRIKSIAPEIILNDLGIPFVKRPSYIEAPAVWRGEKRPSVSIQQNDFGEWLWHDFGSDKGGSWIDLVMVLYDWDYVTAVKFLREKYLGNSEIQVPRIIPKSQRVSTVKILEVKEVSHPALRKYLRERKIEKIPEWLRELHWEVKGKRFFGVGTRTITGSWTVRNRLGKWNLRELSNQRHSYSLIEKGSSYLAVFEGLFDALTWEQLCLKETDLLILNSTVNIEEALKVLEHYEVLVLALDNDDAGKLARRKIKNWFGERIINLLFSAKDLNEAFKYGEKIKFLE
ncbi:toprim domain-containing protein (plasmid) [Desulfurobacterium thermolithotrophum]|uniref:toprim domain-containing protein n=1 Tax=Desulfurobacterium thermolithotrophum TaxID=64160 RepID=UPI0013D20F91|nr:toprim domain-containing protein [Desulfurobacterium thermolithotrophum]